MHFAFTLTMPSRGSWNRAWSGEDRRWVICKSFTQRKWKDRVAKLVGSHRYAFGDGWVAAVEVTEIDKDEKRRLLKASAGFCGYGWMVDSLIEHGEIRA